MIIERASSDESEKSCRVRLFDIAEFSRYDGPGIRTVVYFQGCGAACDWCHSPHSQPYKAPLMYNDKLCVGCGRCVYACSRKVHTIMDDQHLLSRTNCTQCGKCIEECPRSIAGVAGSALHLATVETTVDTLFQQILPYLELNKSEGGITLSGGEALLQSEASEALLRLCKEKGIHTAVETAGLLPMDTYRKVLPWVDMWLFGMRVVTGRERKHAEKIDKVLAFLVDSGADVLPRIPMIPGYFDREEILDKVIELLEKYSLCTVWLNPWNNDYDIKYSQTGFPLLMDKPTENEIKTCRERILLRLKKLKFNVYGNELNSENDAKSGKTLSTFSDKSFE